MNTMEYTKSMTRNQDNTTGKFVRTHNLSFSLEYRSWLNMIQRCENRNHRSYRHYGDRGIRVCKEWRNSFETFYKDLGVKPTPEYSLERIDNNGNYAPDNCRWATKSEQLLNQRLHHKNKSGYAGVFWDKSSQKWRSVITFKGVTEYLGSFDDKREAIKARELAKERMVG